MSDYQPLYARVKRLQLISSRLAEGLIAGTYRTAFKGPGLDFRDVRNYEPGDDVRAIDWNVSARMDSPYIKTFEEERELNLFFVMDMSASMATGSSGTSKLETARNLAAILSYAATKNNDLIGAVFFAGKVIKRISPKKGPTHLSRLFRDMLSLKANNSGSNLDRALRLTHDTLKRRGICVIISDFRTATGWREMTLLARRHDVIAIRISDPSDTEFPASGLLELVDPETGKTVAGFGGSSCFKRAYNMFWDSENIFWYNSCRRRHIDTLVVGTQDDPAAALLQFFERRRRR